MVAKIKREMGMPNKSWKLLPRLVIDDDSLDA